MKRTALSAAFILLAILAGTASATTKPTTFVAQTELDGQSVAKSELTSIVRAAQPNFQEGGAELDEAFGVDSANTAVEIDISGPDTQDAVLYFLFNSDADLGGALGVQEAAMEQFDNAAKLGTVIGYPETATGTYRSLVWNQPGHDRFGNPTAATFAGIVISGDVVSLTNGSPGGVIVEGIAVNDGTYPPSPQTAIALAKWGVSHLARVLAHTPG